MTKIHYFGTGAALNPSVDTTYFFIEHNGDRLYVDAGNGMSLAQRVLSKKIDMPRYLFLTHCHTDHFLGLPHLVRIIGDKELTLLMSTELFDKLGQIMDLVGKGTWFQSKVSSGQITHVSIDAQNSIELFDRQIQPINLFSKKAEQYGFSLHIGSKHIVFFGDEAIDVLTRDDLQRYHGCDRLLCEAFCTSAKAASKDPASKAHITASMAGTIATQLNTRNLIISHIAEDSSQSRVLQLQEILADAQSTFSGTVYVPQDETSIEL